MKRRKLFLIIITILLAAMLISMAACTQNGGEDDGDGDVVDEPVKRTLTANAALDKIYDGLITGKSEMDGAVSYGVENEFTLYIQSILNYSVKYKAVYAENNADSEIYLSLFDNNAHKERITLFYDGKDLFIDFEEKKSKISGFGTTIMFGSFFQACKQIDMTPRFYDGENLASIFNRNAGGGMINLGTFIGDENVSYNRAGENGEVVEINETNLTQVIDFITAAMDRMFRGVDDKFDIVTQKFLGFKLKRLLESRFSYIVIKGIEMDFVGNKVADTEWEVNGNMQDSSPFFVRANVGYSLNPARLPEGENYGKTRYSEINLGQNDFEGTVVIPKISDVPFDMETVTDLNTDDNMRNSANLRIYNASGSDFISLYYKNGTAYLDATGLNDWMDGAIELSAFNLPKVYLDGVNLSKLISAGYNNLAKSALEFLKGLTGTEGDADLYDAIIENFYSEGNVVYYKVTEELIKKIRKDDESAMSLVAKLIGIEEKQLASYLGEDFFSSAELIIGYNLDTGVITLKLNVRGEELFTASLIRKDFVSVYIPSDCNAESAAYAPIKYPTVLTMAAEADLNVRNGKTSTDVSKVFGITVGDITGQNTPYTLTGYETLKVSVTVTQNILDQTRDNFVNLNVYSVSGGNKKVLLNVCTNPKNYEEYLISYYLPMGDNENKDGLFFRVSRELLKSKASELLGEENIFGTDSVMNILTAVMGMDGISTVEKTEGWFKFSLIAQGDRDPVNELIGIKDTTATVKAQVRFSGVDDDIDVEKFVEPIITDLSSITIESIYSDGSAWKNSVEVCINSRVFKMVPPYTSESIEVVTGKKVYNPTAELFGKVITYEVRITTEEGTYKIKGLPERTVVLDPTETDVLPSEIRVRYDNGNVGNLPCVFVGFDSANITLAGFNLAGFAGEFDKCTPSKVIIGVNSIMNVEYEIYILVNNRKVNEIKDNNGNGIFAPGGVPVVGRATIDPYTYAMKKRDNPDFDPIADEIRKENMELRFDNVYGETLTPDGETELLTYDILGVNYFALADLGLSWEYDLSKITWLGSYDYAYAVFGSGKSAVKIAVNVIVSAQEVCYVQIDDEDHGYYTIDFLVKDSYAIPSQSGIRHNLSLYFYTDKDHGGIAEKHRKLVTVRPAGISDEDYYNNYVYGSLNWAGADYITKNPTVITRDGTANLFEFDGRQGNSTTAMFGEGLTVGVQTVGLTVNVPSRYQSQNNDKTGVSAANSCTETDGKPIFNNSTVEVSPASFTRDGVIYAPLEINPYDTAARLPSTVFLTVAKNYDTKGESFYDENGNNRGNAVIKEYNITWVTTDSDGRELNLIERKEDGTFGLKHPVVHEQVFVVYGKIGDRGQDRDGNPGYVWIRMLVKNTASYLKDVKLDGVPIENISLIIDPYKEYVLPSVFEAQLESGAQVKENNIDWYVSLYGEDNWFPVRADSSYENYYDEEGLARYDDNGKFIFSYRGGKYVLRYALEGGTEIIRQEITLSVQVEERTIVTTDGNTLTDIYAKNHFVDGYTAINGYDVSSSELLARLREICADGIISVAFENVTDENGNRIPYILPVVWTTAAEDEEGYDNSIDKLLSLFVGVQDGQTFYLTGTVGTGTVNSREIKILFTFDRNIVEKVGFDRLYVALSDGAASIDENDDGVSMDTLVASGELNIRFNKPFALKDGNDLYASPYRYIEYLFGAIELYFEVGTVSTVVPELDFGEYAGDEDKFNKKVLMGTAEETDETLTVIRLVRFSQGSVLQTVEIKIHTIKDERLDRDRTIVAELFDEESQELYGGEYSLPNKITVNYRNSGAVTYSVNEWTVGLKSQQYFDKETVTGIPVNLINPLRSNVKDLHEFYFYFGLPCEDADFNITVSIPNKDIDKTRYNAKGETKLYDIENGILKIDNPYLYYDEQAEYGMDVSKIPSVIEAITSSSKYDITGTNVHRVNWTYEKRENGDRVFDAKYFAQGIGADTPVLFAKATLPAYYDATGRKQSQTVELYISVARLTYYGISYGEMPVKEDTFGDLNVITVDPYNDVMNYRGYLTLPTQGLTVLFNGGLDSYEFGTAQKPLNYSLLDADGKVVVDSISGIPYDEKGHSLTYPEVKDERVLRLAVKNIPGYPAGLPVYVNIQSRIIESVHIENYSFNADGIIQGVKELEGTYFIDPYNTATFALPASVPIKFEENDHYETQTVAGWEIFDEAGSEWIGLDGTANFYSRQSGDKTATYGFYKTTADSFKGGVYRLRGYISLGRTSTGISGKQNFEVTVIVLNRSLRKQYSVSHRYDDPLGGLLSDIPSYLSEEMFVDYDKFYAYLGLPEGYAYSEWSTPVVPFVNWNTKNSENVVDYRGDFDKDIEGNVYFNNVHTQYMQSVIGKEIEEKYELLIDSRMWDEFFTADGEPQPVYTVAAAAKLAELKKELEREVIHAAYQKVVRAYNAGSETERQYANYMSNVLVNEIINEYRYNRVTQFTEIVGVMYGIIKEAKDLNPEGTEGIIYEFWQATIDNIVAQNDNFDPQLSEYRQLKADKYAKAMREVFTTTVEYNTAARARIKAALRVYIASSKWDAYFDRATDAERKIMTSLINGDTELAKATALNNFLNFESRTLGSAGETASANITAPSMSLGNIIDRYENGKPVYKTEFLFNLYSSVSFTEEADVEAVYNYYNVYKKYIDEGLNLALTDLRNDKKGETLEQYVLKKINEYVKTAVPVEYDKNTGAEIPVLENFDYVYGEFGTIDNPTYNAKLSGYWDTLYSYRKTKAVSHLEEITGKKESDWKDTLWTAEYWTTAKNGHIVQGQRDIYDKMNAIETAVSNEIIGAHIPESKRYSEYFNRYVAFLKEYAVRVEDGFYAEAVKDADYTMVNAIIESYDSVQTILDDNGGAAGAFAIMFEEIGNLAYEMLLTSFSGNEQMRNIVLNAYNSQTQGNRSGVGTIFYLGRNLNVNTTVKTRAWNIFNALIGGDKAFDTLKENLSEIGVSYEYFDALVTEAEAVDGILDGNSFDKTGYEEEYEKYRKYVLVNNVSEALRKYGDASFAIVNEYINSAKRDGLGKGFETLLEKRNDRASVYIRIREEVCKVKKNAFIKYINSYAALGEAVGTEIEGIKTTDADYYLFGQSEKIVSKLSADTSFPYTTLLNPDESTKKTLRNEALNYYNENIADEKTAAAVNYTVSVYGENAYEILLTRKDLGKKFLSDINSAYYFTLLNYMLEKSKETFVGSYVITDEERAEGLYTEISTSVYNMFVAVSYSKDTGITDAIRAEADRQYVLRKYENSLKAYTDEINAYKRDTALIKHAEDAAFDVLYAADKEKFDEIISTFTLDFDKAFDYFKKLLKENEASAFYAAAEETVEEKALVELYDSLGIYSLAGSIGAAEQTAINLCNSVYTVFDSLDLETRTGLNRATGNLFDGKKDMKAALTILGGYGKIAAVTDENLAASAERICNIILSYAVLPESNETEKAVSELIEYSVGTDYVSGGASADGNIIKTRAYGNFLALLYSLEDVRKNISADFLTEENLNGDFTVTTVGYKKEFVDGLIRELSERKRTVFGETEYAFIPLTAAADLMKVIREENLTEIGARLQREIAARRFDEFGETIYNKMSISSAHGELNTDMEISDALSAYLAVKEGYVDEAMRKFDDFDSLRNNFETILTFETEDKQGADGRHIIAFDKEILENSSVSSVKAPVYIGNAYKMNADKSNAYKIDGVDYRYVHLEIRYVDFTDSIGIDNIKTDGNANFITIDPFNPVLPETVHAYGVYSVYEEGSESGGGTVEVLMDIGHVNVEYAEIFYYNVYEGTDIVTGSYTLNFTDIKGNRYTNFPVRVEYKNRTVNKVYLESNLYGGQTDTDRNGKFFGKQDMFNTSTGKNTLTVNPVNSRMLDVANRSYALPETVTILFADGTDKTVEDVVWDLSSVEYSLVGRSGLDLRILSYTYSENGVRKKVEFNYGTSVMRVYTVDEDDPDQAIGEAKQFINVPGGSIWNMSLNVIDCSVQNVMVTDETDGETVVLGSKSLNGDYIEVPAANYRLDPFDTVFPENYSITFNGGESSEIITDGGWRLEPGSNGTNKMIDIIMGKAGDKNVMTVFTYLGYTVRVRFVADDIELEGLGSGEYYDGGTLYLVVGGGSVFEQLAANYAYFYYNFSNIASKPDYRKVPLSFIDANISGISTESENVTYNVRGVLGWDKKQYPGGMTMNPNISFTVAVIDPKLYGELDGKINQFVINDLIGMPSDGIGKVNDPNEPKLIEYFVKVNTNGEEVRFPIDRNSIEYDIVNGEVSYLCKFTMTGRFARLFADKNGGKELSFTVRLPLKTYIFSEFATVTFDRTPIKNAKGEDMWKWTDVPENSVLYRDGIIWTLGKELKSSYLPKAITDGGKTIELLWDLSGVNVNLSTEDSARGYYLIKGYYYNKDYIWNYLELAVFIDKYDASEQVTEALGGNLELYSTYNGRYYNLPIDLTAENMLMLGSDGAYRSLSPESIIVEYKNFGDEDRKYSTTELPLNTGDYSVRITIVDENVTLNEGLILKLIIRPVSINAANITFVGEVMNTVMYTYDGSRKALAVESGLPTVRVANWFTSVDEKNAVYDSFYRQVSERDDLTESKKSELAKSLAYMEFYGRVTPATRTYLDNVKYELSESAGITDQYALNAAMFDRLQPNLEICEVVPKITYIRNNVVMSTVPVDVGYYTAVFTIDSAENNGNYVLNGTVSTKIIEIVQPEINYAIVDYVMEYNGKAQNPRISGLYNNDGTVVGGVELLYTYSFGMGSEAKYFESDGRDGGGIKDVGIYTCSVKINGGNNYPSGEIEGQQIRITARDLYIDVENDSGFYLAPIADISDNAVFNGLVGNDTSSVFGTAEIITDAKDYYVPGVYGLYLTGFRIDGLMYTVTDESVPYEVNGKTYYRMYLKPANVEGSLYNYVTESGNYVYAEIISMVGTKEAPGNYRIFVAERGDYVIDVNRDGDENVYTVNNETELKDVLAGIKDGERASIYLAAERVEEDGVISTVKTDYGDIVIDVNAAVTIIGCYDEAKNIVVFVNSLTVKKGTVTIKILAFETDIEGNVSVDVGAEASSVSVYDCLFDGKNTLRTVGIQLASGYAGKIYVDNTGFISYSRGILAYGGNMEIANCEFVNNIMGVQILSNGIDIRVSASEFTGNETGLYLETTTPTVLNNVFDANRTAIYAPGWNAANLNVQNEFTDTNGENVVTQ